MAHSRLVILGSSLTALAVARDAHALGMTPVIVDTRRGVAFHSRWVQPVVVPKAPGDPTLIRDLLAALTGQDFLIATSDAWLKVVVAHREQLEGSCRGVLHPSNSALETCLDKAKFGVWCREQELPSPRTWLADREPRPAGLAPPLLIRPASTIHAAGAAQKLPKAVEAHDEAELDKWLAAFAEQRCPAIVSESLLAKSLTQLSVPFVRTADTLDAFVACKVRPAPKHCSVGSYVELATDPKAEQLVKRAAAALDYFGVGEAEILRAEPTGELYLIEINARPWLQYALAPASGHDFLGPLVGAPRQIRRVDRRRWIDFDSDLYGAFSSSVGAVRRGELGLGSYLLSLLRANVYARFDFRDPMPAFRRIDG